MCPRGCKMHFASNFGLPGITRPVGSKRELMCRLCVPGVDVCAGCELFPAAERLSIAFFDHGVLEAVQGQSSNMTIAAALPSVRHFLCKLCQEITLSSSLGRVCFQLSTGTLMERRSLCNSSCTPAVDRSPTPSTTAGHGHTSITTNSSFIHAGSNRSQ